jgi:SAM-dependent methyltransferase
MSNRDQGYPDAQPTSKLDVICTRLEPEPRKLSDCWTLLAEVDGENGKTESPDVNKLWLLALERVEQQVAAPNGLKLLSTVYAYDDSPDPPLSRAVWVAGLIPENQMVAPLLAASRQSDLFHRSTITVKRMDGSFRQHLSEKDLSNSRPFRDVVQRLRKENLAIVFGQDKYRRFGIMRPRPVPDETDERTKEGRDFVADCYVAKIKDVRMYLKNSVLPGHSSLSTQSAIEENDSVPLWRPDNGGFDAATEDVNHDSSWKPPAAEEYSFNTTSLWKPPTEDDDDNNDATNGETQKRSWNNSEQDSGWGMPSNSTKKTRLDDSTYHRDVGAAAADEFYSNLTRSLDTRADSRLFHMRAFNGWVKATQIAELDPKSGPAVTGKKKQRAATGAHSAPLRVLDLACGKGGDLGKWVLHSRGIGNYVGSDVARGSLRDAALRARKMRSKLRNCTFTCADLGADVPGRLKSSKSKKMQKLLTWSLQDEADGENSPPDFRMKRGGGIAETDKFDVVSIQFAIHYMMQTHKRARRFFRTVSELLEIGGNLIATTIDARVVLDHLMTLGLDVHCDDTATDKWASSSPEALISVGGGACKIRFAEDVVKKLFAHSENIDDLFGLEYVFTLVEGSDHGAGVGDAVNLPEWLTPLPVLQSLANEVGLELEYAE